MNGIVKYKVGDQIKELSFEHAKALFRQIIKNQSGKIPVITSNHEFIENELIIKPSDTDSTKTSKRGKGTKGARVRK